MAARPFETGDEMIEHAALLLEFRRHESAPDLLARSAQTPRLARGAAPVCTWCASSGSIMPSGQMVWAGHHQGRAGRQQFGEHRLRVDRAPVVDDQHADVLDRRRRFGLLRAARSQAVDARPRAGCPALRFRWSFAAWAPGRTIVTLAVIAGQAKESRLEIQARRLRPDWIVYRIVLVTSLSSTSIFAARMRPIGSTLTLRAFIARRGTGLGPQSPSPAGVASVAF